MNGSRTVVSDVFKWNVEEFRTDMAVTFVNLYA